MQQQDESKNIVWHRPVVTRTQREHKNHHKAFALWFTGLSGSGKSTLAHAVEEELFQLGLNTFVLDGDNIRHGLCGDLGFSDRDRRENIRRVSETVNLLLEAGVITLTAFISPSNSDRAMARILIPNGDFIEIYCHCPLEICESRDVKGLYKKARCGQIKDFTGISSPYEQPENPELRIDTHLTELTESVNQVTSYLLERGVLSEKRLY